MMRKFKQTYIGDSVNADLLILHRLMRKYVKFWQILEYFTDSMENSQIP